MLEFSEEEKPSQVIVDLSSLRYVSKYISKKRGSVVGSRDGGI